MKPRDNWGPADYMAAMLGQMIAILIVYFFVAYWLDHYNIWPFTH